MRTPEVKFRRVYGRTLEAMGNFGEAVTQYKLAHQIVPDDPKLNWILGSLLHRQNSDETIVYVKRASDADPAAEKYALFAARLSADSGDVAGAMSILRRCLAAAPDATEASDELQKLERSHAG